MKRKIIAVIAIGMLLAAPALQAADPAAAEYVLQPGEQWRTAEKTVQGSVVSVNPARIVLEYGLNGSSVREIHLDLGDENNIMFSHLKSLKDISPSDLVKINYRDKFVQDKEGRQTQYQRTVTAIALIKRGTGSDSLLSMEKTS